MGSHALEHARACAPMAIGLTRCHSLRALSSLVNWMPHCHSVRAAALRRQRAIHRDYLAKCQEERVNVSSLDGGATGAVQIAKNSNSEDRKGVTIDTVAHAGNLVPPSSLVGGADVQFEAFGDPVFDSEPWA